MEAKEWARPNNGVSVTAKPGKGCAAVVKAACELPLCPRDAFELFAHPDNAVIFRGIERCTYRRILWAAGDSLPGDGRQTIEVENESDWQFLFIKGSIRTRMLVHEDPTAGTIHVKLAPSGGNAPLQHLNAKWRFDQGSSPCSCRVTLEQEVHPKGLPPFFHNAFRAMAALQVRKTFEDLYAEALRINEGRPSLGPYAEVARKEISESPCAAEESAGAAAAAAAARLAAKLFAQEDDPSSVLAFEDSNSSCSTSGAATRSPNGGRSRAAALAPRPGGLRSHPIGSLVDMACLAGVTGASLAAQAAVQAAAQAAAAADTAAAASASWRNRLYTLLQKLWVVSNAALGLAPNAVAELEEMAVLV